MLLPQEALCNKAKAKQVFQKKFGLTVSDLPEAATNPFVGYQLVVFLGRLTHQKGCDSIAQAADDFLAQCPQVSHGEGGD